MIFPKDQKIIRRIMNEQLKREALELIISLYLERVRDQELVFLKDNFGTTENLATGIRTNLFHGLSYQNLEKNRIDYGENAKREPKKCSGFSKILINEICSVYFISIFIIWIIVQIYGRQNYIQVLISRGEIIFIANLIAVAFRVLTEYICSRSFANHSFEKDKTNLYQVYRNETLLEIKEHELIVGDIVQLGFKQKVPASGLLISNKQIFIKEGKGQTKIEHKMSLQNCLKKIKTMSALQLKLCYEEKSLPSPVLRRGSELIHGSTYRMMILSVTEEDLLNQYEPQEEDKFSFRLYSEWIKSLESKWQIKSYIIIIAFTTINLFASIIADDIFIARNQFTFRFFLDILMTMSTYFFILNPANLGTFLRVYELRLYKSAEMPEEIVDYLLVEKIICDEKNIVKDDNVQIMKYALCQKMDLLDSLDGGLHPLTVQIVFEIQNIFELGKRQEEMEEINGKVSKFVLMNKKKTKIISCPIEQNQSSGIMQKIYQQIAQVSGKQSSDYNKEHRLSLKLRKNENEKLTSQQFLSFPKQANEIENLNEIINSRCRIKSRDILAGIVQLAEKGCKTYYYETYDTRKMDKITHVISNGLLVPMSEEDRDRMKMLARKIQMIYQLTPIMLGFHEGPYRNKPLKILCCLIGVNISEDNKILQAFKDFQEVGIKSIIVISKSWSNDEQFIKEQQIFEEYRQRKWVQSAHNTIFDIEKIKQQCGRLVCSSCLISNCDCKDKVEELSHIQPFLSSLESMKLIYNLDEEGISFVEKALLQLRYNHICINSHNISATHIVQSIKNCLLFVEGIRRSLPLLYLLPLIYFLTPVIFWAQDLQILAYRQIAISFGFCQLWVFLCMIFKIETSIGNAFNYNRKKIIFVDKKDTIFTYATICFIIVFAQLFFNLSYLIPESADGYDEIISKYSFPSSCKYYPNTQCVTNTFKSSECSPPNTYYYSKISSMISVYLYFVVWISVVVNHRNFRSLGSNIMYVLSLATGIFAIMFPQYFYLYPFGMNYIQMIIVMVGVIVTVILSKLITEILMIEEDFFHEYFQDQLESSIDFGLEEDNNHYSKSLKRYAREKILLKTFQV